MTIKEHDFLNAFEAMGRADSWTRAGLFALFDHLEEVYPEMELDVVSLDCEFAEYSSLIEWAKDYFSDYREQLNINGDESEEEIDDAIRSHIEDHGQLIKFNGGIIVSKF